MRIGMVVCGICIMIIIGGCSSDKKNKSDGPDYTGADTADSFDTGPQSTDSTTNPGDATMQFGPLGDSFRYGINGGHRNADWGDDVQAILSAGAGCNSQRISLPESHLDRWGYEIETGDMAAYVELGLTEQVGFLTKPIREHSTAPSDVADWELAYYMPSNLYEPILVDGAVNPENYWAKYVFDTVSIYKEWIDVWEIWNEPDYTGNWQDTLTWGEQAPTKAQLPRFNGSIFDYVRMLRVSKVAANMADPNAKIATGGIGYATFLSAILRYTDNPEDGSVTDAYPRTGASYVDVVSFHHYPIYTDGNSDAAVEGYLSHFADLKNTVAQAQAEVIGYENTESGAPSIVVGDYPGSDAYAVNYLMKVMVSAQAAGVHGIDWFVLSNSDANGGGDTSYHYMGLYEDVIDLSTTDEAVMKPTGIAYATLSALIGKAKYDATATTSLDFDADITAHAFVTVQGKEAIVLWAAVDAGEKADAQLAWNGAPVDVYDWDYSDSGAAVGQLSSGDTLQLDGHVKILVAQ